MFSLMKEKTSVFVMVFSCGAVVACGKWNECSGNGACCVALPVFVWELTELTVMR